MPMNLTGVKWKDTDFESRWPDASFKDKDGEGCIIHEKGRNWHEKHYLLPLPTDQLKLNPQTETKIRVGINNPFIIH